MRGGGTAADSRLSASGGDGGVGGNVCDRAEPAARRTTRWRTHRVLRFLRVPTGFVVAVVDSDPSAHGLLLVGGMDRMGDSAAGEQSASGHRWRSFRRCREGDRGWPCSRCSCWSARSTIAPLGRHPMSETLSDVWQAFKRASTVFAPEYSSALVESTRRSRSSSYISQSASTSTITCVRGIFFWAACASIARKVVLSFSRLGDLSTK